LTDPVEKIAAAVLYEGYVLWPYRRSAQKNQRRWTFGGVYPRAYSEAEGGNDPWLMQTQCLVVGEKPTVEVKVRFLHVVERKVAKLREAGIVRRGGFETRSHQEARKPERLEFVDELRVGKERYLAWEEAAEREVIVPGLGLAELQTPMRTPISVPAGIEEEPQLWRFVVHPQERAPGADVVEDVREQISRLLATVLGERLRGLGLDSGGAEAWAHGLVGMVQSAGDWWLQRRTMSRPALTDYLTTLIWGGVAGVLSR